MARSCWLKRQRGQKASFEDEHVVLKAKHACPHSGWVKAEDERIKASAGAGAATPGKMVAMAQQALSRAKAAYKASISEAK